MPKVPTLPSHANQPARHNPLAEDYAPSAPPKQKTPKRRKVSQSDDPDADAYIDNKASQRILRIGQDLVEEDKSELEAAKPNPAFEVNSRFDDYEPWPEEEDDEAWREEEEETHELDEIDPADQEIFNRFHPSTSNTNPDNLTLDSLSSHHNHPPEDSPQSTESTNLADLILSKIAEHESHHPTSTRHQPLPTTPSDPDPIPEAAIKVYTSINPLLSTYRSGPLPKPIKLLPTLPPYQLSQLLDLTNPPTWSPHAHLSILRLFISQKPDVATPYLRNILLPAIRADITETKKLDVHLYSALKKSLYKPAAFFKGIVFPLLEGSDGGGDCTLREAQIVSSVVARVRIPVLHSAAALRRCLDVAAERFTLARSDGGGTATNLFIRTLLAKKYALPYNVIDALVFHFIRFKALKAHAKHREEYVRLPVMWHQSFLEFAQRYRNDITEDQREALLDVVNAIGHQDIGPEVRRELLAGRGRGVEEVMEGVEGGDDTMMVGA